MVKLYMHFRELAGADSLTLELPDSATVQDFLRELGERVPKLDKRIKRGEYILMKGGRWPKAHETLSDGDVLALFPPVGGG
ncbi:MAG TPA: MoaD/ThiS family protein [Candidatus Korarchaeota archaeon]|nr:MoaD/ThiS family protein [Candidatus Korarchaeota archaeon]